MLQDDRFVRNVEGSEWKVAKSMYTLMMGLFVAWSGMTTMKLSTVQCRCRLSIWLQRAEKACEGGCTWLVMNVLQRPAGFQENLAEEVETLEFDYVCSNRD